MHAFIQLFSFHILNSCIHFISFHFIPVRFMHSFMDAFIHSMHDVIQVNHSCMQSLIHCNLHISLLPSYACTHTCIRSGIIMAFALFVRACIHLCTHSLTSYHYFTRFVHSLFNSCMSRHAMTCNFASLHACIHALVRSFMLSFIQLNKPPVHSTHYIQSTRSCTRSFHVIAVRVTHALSCPII